MDLRESKGFGGLMLEELGNIGLRDLGGFRGEG